MSEPIGKIVSIALRSAVGGPMREVAQAAAEVDGGLVGDVPEKTPDLGVSFLSLAQWNEVMSELQIDLPWHTRRANVLINGPRTLAEYIGHTIQIGEAQMIFTRDVPPCGQMDEAHQGLKEALKPESRGGIAGRVIKAGTIHVGDAIERI